MTSLSFRVYGTPAPAGSKTVVPTAAGPRPVDGGSKAARAARATWRQDVVQAARAAIERHGWVKTTAAVRLSLVLIVPRPKGLPQRRRDGTIPQPTKRPDVTKLLRATEDALTTAGVWADDSQVVALDVTKRYAAPAYDEPGAIVHVALAGPCDTPDGDLGRAQDVP